MHAINLCKQCYNVRRLKRGERKVTASRWRGDDSVGGLWHGATCANNVGTFHQTRGIKAGAPKLIQLEVVSATQKHKC